MNLLLLTEASGLQERLRRAFSSNHRLTSVADVPTALERLNGSPFDAFIVDWSLSRDSAAGAIESVRRVARGDRLFVLAMIEREQTGAIQAVYRTGVDDFVIKPCMPEELAARLESPRAARRTGEFQLPPKDTRTKPTLPLPTPQPLDLAIMHSLASITSNEFRMLTGIAVHAGPWRMPPRPAFAARVSLSLAPLPVALALSVAVEAAPLRWLGSQLLQEGDVRRSSLENLVCEIANTFAGSVKRAAHQDGVRFQVGLPTVVPLHAFTWGAQGAASETPQSGSQQLAFTLKSEDHRFALSLIATVARVRHVALPVSRLREGTVLAEDLEGGTLSSPIAAGTCLTSSVVERLTRAFDPSYVVRVEERFDPLLHAD